MKKTPVTYFTKKVDPSLAKSSSKFNEDLAKLGKMYLVKSFTVVQDRNLWFANASFFGFYAIVNMKYKPYDHKWHQESSTGTFISCIIKRVILFTLHSRMLSNCWLAYIGRAAARYLTFPLKCPAGPKAPINYSLELRYYYRIRLITTAFTS